MQHKQAVYWMPGMAASSRIFERISLGDAYESVFLEWHLPHKNQHLQDYVKELSLQITHPNPILIGVSFGGVIVQELSHLVQAKKVIIISSIKTKHEMPQTFKLAKQTGLYKWLPTGALSNLKLINKFAVGDYLKQRIKLYETFLERDEKVYLDWAIDAILNWDREASDPEVVHIHGTKDEVFPVSNITNYIKVIGGTHIMIINRFRWFNENLLKIIEA